MSAYRYHKSMNSTFEVWKITRNMCNDCGANDHKAIFSMCEYACHYTGLLSKVDEDMGISIEAIHSRTAIEVMLANVKRWSADPNVLHLSVDHLSKSFKGTVGCMFKFLGEPVYSKGMTMRGDISYELNHAEKFASHATRGKYNDDHVRRFLEGHAHWGSQFRVTTRIFQAIYHRQGQLYDCPVP